MPLTLATFKEPISFQHSEKVYGSIIIG